ncbi:MAG: TetR/AcrR family transcriptional regulator [Aquiluna sp.]|jgi:AcrR family transcriptional regulator
MKKKSYHHGNLEEALLKVGMKEARASGSRNLGVTHLAKLVDVTPMAVYRHFPNGENLKAAISQQAREELARRMANAVAKETDVKKRFMATGREYINFGLQEPGLLSVAFLDCEELPNREDNPSAREILHDAILDLCNEGSVKAQDVQSIAHFAWSVVHGFTLLASSSDPQRPGSKSAEIEEILERAWQGVTQYSKTPKK